MIGKSCYHDYKSKRNNNPIYTKEVKICVRDKEDFS